MLFPTNSIGCFQEIPTLAIQLPYELIHASTLISKQAHPLQRWIPRQPIQNTRTTHWECTLATMQHAEIKKPTTKTCTDRPSAECTNHGIQILRKRYTYPPNHSELGNIKYQEQCYGITESVKPYLAHYHFLCKETTHVDCNSQATSPILRWGTIPSTISFVMQRQLHMWTAIFKQHHSISIWLNHT